MLFAAEYLNSIPSLLESHLKEIKFGLIILATASKYMVKKGILTKDDIIHFWEKEADSEVVVEIKKEDKEKGE